MKPTKDSIAVLEAAQTYTSKGYFVVRIPEGRNDYLPEGWQNVLLKKEDLPERFKDGDGLAACGESQKCGFVT
jgi:hypothetical protein